MELGRDVLLLGFVVINKWRLLSSFSQDRNKRKYLTIFLSRDFGKKSCDQIDMYNTIPYLQYFILSVFLIY